MLSCRRVRVSISVALLRGLFTVRHCKVIACHMLYTITAFFSADLVLKGHKKDALQLQPGHVSLAYITLGSLDSSTFVSQVHVTISHIGVYRYLEDLEE